MHIDTDMFKIVLWTSYFSTLFSITRQFLPGVFSQHASTTATCTDPLRVLKQTFSHREMKYCGTLAGCYRPLQ